MISNVSVYLCIVNKIIHARTNYRANIQISSFTVAEIEIAVPLANIRLKGDLYAPKGGAASAMTADKLAIDSFRAPSISVIGLPAAYTRDITGSLARICTLRVLFFSLFPFPSSHQSGATPLPRFSLPFLPPTPPHALFARAR